MALAAQVMLLAFFSFAPAFAQTEPAPPSDLVGNDPNGANLSQGAQNTDETVPDQNYNEPPTNYVQQAAEQNTDLTVFNVEEMLKTDFVDYNDTYYGLSAFWSDDIVGNLFHNIGQLIGKWLTELINGWISDAVQFLTGILRTFVLNPNIAVNGISGTLGGGSGQPSDDISPFIRQGADVMYGIAVDLLLLLFILCIWKYWADAAWRGGGNLMGAVGRLIFTAGLLLAWPTIYAFEIQISNEMIKAIYFNSADQVAMLDAAMAAAVKGGLLAGAGLIMNATAPVGGQVLGGLLGGGAGGMVLGTVGNIVAFVGLIIYLILGGILIAELVYILILKAIQTALLTAQYMFAPIFIVFFATPDTENICAGYVKSFVEVSLWTFVWVGLLKILVIIVLSDFNPWGKIVMAVGVLQIMIQVPSFLARAQISPMSDFISAGLLTGGLLSAGKALTNVLGNRAMHFAKAVGDHPYTGARGMPQSQKVELNSLPNGAANPEHLNNIRKRADEGKNFEFGKDLKDKDGKDPKKPGDGGPPLGPDGKPITPPGGPNQPKKPGEDEKNKKDQNGNPIDPTTGKPLVTPQNPLGTPGAGQPGAQGTPDGSQLASSLGDQAKKTATTGAGIATAAALAGGALAAAQTNNGTGLPGQNPGAGAGSEQDRKNLEQQALEAQKKANDLKTGGTGDGTNAVQPPGRKDATLEPGKGTGQGGQGDKGKDLNTGDKPNATGNLTPGDLKTAASAAGLTGVGQGGKGLTGQGEQGKDLSITTPVDTTKTGEKDPTKQGKQGENQGQGAVNARDLASLAEKGPNAGGTGVTGGQDRSTTPPIQLEVEEEAPGAGKNGGTQGRDLVAGQGDKGAKGANLTGQGVAGQPPGSQTLKTAGQGELGAGADATKLDVTRKPGETGVKGGNTGAHLDANAALGDAAKTVATGRNPDLTTATVLEDGSVVGDPGSVPPNAGKTIATGSGAGQGGGGDKTGKDAVVTAQPGGGTRLEQGGSAQPVVTPGGKNVATGGGQGGTVDQQVLANQGVGPDGRALTTGTPLNADVAGGELTNAPDGTTIRPVVSLAGGQNQGNGAPVQGNLFGKDGVVQPGGQTTGQGVVQPGMITPGAGVRPVAGVGGQVLDQNVVAGQPVGGDGRPLTPTSLNPADVNAGQDLTGTQPDGVTVRPVLGANLPGSGVVSRPDTLTTQGLVQGGGQGGNNVATGMATPGLNQPVTGSGVKGPGGEIVTPVTADGRTGVPGAQPTLTSEVPVGTQMELPFEAGSVTPVVRPGGVTGGQGQGAGAQPVVNTVQGQPIAGANTGAGLNTGVVTPTGVVQPTGVNTGRPPGEVQVNQTGVVPTTAGVNPVTVNAVDGGTQDFTPTTDGTQVNATVNRTPGSVGAATGPNGIVNVNAVPPITPGGGTPTNTPVNAVNAQLSGSQTGPKPAGAVDTSGLNNGPPAGGLGGGGGNGGGGRPIDVPFDDGSGGDGGGGGGGNPNDDVGIPTKGGSSGMAGKPWDNFQQAYYRWVPGRGLTVDIRTAQGPTQGPSPDGGPTVVGDGKGHVNHVRYGQGGTDEQKSLQMISAGYAQNINSDNEAFDAARQSAIDAGEDQPKGALQRIAAGILAYNGSNWNQTAAAKQNFQRSMFKHAVLGSEAYCNGQPGNAYTEYLTNRYGPMTDDQQAWGIHIMSDGTSPESGWNPAVVPATETLLNNSIPITAANRAMAANYNVLKSPAWQRGSAIRGGVKYMAAVAKQALPADAHPMEVDAFMGGAAPRMGPDLVNACAAITMAYGEEYCSDVDLVNNVALAAQGGQPKDYQNAFAGIQRIMTVSATMKSGGGGGGRTVTAQTVPIGGGGGGSGSGGGASTSVSGTILPPAGPGPVNGRPNQQQVDVIFTDDGGSGAPDHAQMPMLQASSSPMDNQGAGGSDIHTRVIDARTGGGNSGPGQHASVEVRHTSSRGGADYSGQVMNTANQIAGTMKMDVSRARQIYMDMRAVGFTDDQISNSKILSTTMQVTERDPSMMHTAAIAANVVPPKDFSTETVETVQSMLDCDSRWNGGNIDRPSIFTAQQIIQAHIPMAAQQLGAGASQEQIRQQACAMAYPTKDYVDSVRMDPRFFPRPVKTGHDQNGNATYGNSQVPGDVLAERLRRRALGEVDGFLRQSGLT